MSNNIIPEEPQVETATEEQAENTIEVSNTTLVEDAILEVPVCPEFETDEELAAQTKRGRGWGIFLSVYFVLLLALSALGLQYFYKYLKQYESTTPTFALEQYMQWVREKNFDAIYSSSDFKTTYLNTEQEYIKYLATLFDGDTSTLKIVEKANDTENVKDYSVYKDYVVYMDNNRVCDLTLIKNPARGENAWDYVTEVHYRPSFLLYAAEDVRITINGEDLSIFTPPSTAVQETLLSGSKDLQILPPIYCYTIGELLNPPTIEALTLNGQDCRIEQAEDGSYYVYTPAPDSEFLRSEYEELAINTAFKYAEFVAKDVKREDFLALIYENSNLYDTIQTFEEFQTIKHDSYEFTVPTISDYAQYSSSDFSCVVSFKPVYTYKKETIEVPTIHCRVTFIQVEDEWKLLSAELITEDSETDEPIIPAETP